MKATIKKVLSMGLAIALTAAVSVTGTMAYLTSEDSDVNVMTLGNVKIEQHEYQRVQNDDGSFEKGTIDDITSYLLEDFEQGKSLLPVIENPSSSGWDAIPVRMRQVDSYGGMDVFATPNAQDKFVTVENTGRIDAYIRTIVAIEVGSTDGSLIGSSYHMTWTSNEVGSIEINGNTYFVYEYVYAGAQLSDGSWRHENGVLPAGDTSYPNLAQVYLKAEATNEDCENIDGNKNGTLDILVLSQAVQADGFENAQTALDTAFGDVNAANVQEWFGAVEAPVLVDNAEDLASALANGSTVVLTEDINAGGQVFVVNGGVLDGNGNTLTVDSGSAAYESGLTVSEGVAKNVTVTGAFRGLGVGGSGASEMTGDVVYENVTVIGATYGINIGVGNGHKLTMIDCTLGDWNSYSGLESAEFVDCTFTSEGNYYASQRISANATFTYTNCEFQQNTYNNTSGNENYYLDSYGNGTIVLDNCTVNGVAVTSENVGDLFQITEKVTVVVK